MVIFIISVAAIYMYCLNCILERKLNTLKEQQSAQESFLSTLIHDLKTPVISQLSALKMLERGDFGSLSSEQAEIAETMYGSCKYMANLIEIILRAYSDLGKIILNKTKFNIVELVTGLCDETKCLCAEKGQIVRFHNFSEGCFVYADKLQMRRVILNLLSNAITYGYRETVIEISIKVSANSFEFYIENISKQIPSEELVKVFDKYSKTKYSHFNKSGTGLGLYLVKQIIEKHNGRVYARSDINGKCTFGFVIPNYEPLRDEKSRFPLKKSAF